MSRQVVKVSKALDRLGYKLVVDLYTGAYTSEEASEEHPGLRYATEVVRTIGAQYSYAYIGVPVQTFGAEWAPAVALQSDGPAGRVRLRSRAKVKMVDYNGNAVPLLVGYLVQYAHSIDEDSVVGMVMDDRWLLSKVTCFGSAVFDPVSKVEYFDAARPLCFNFMGYPDCIDMGGGKCRFAPGRLYGYKQQESIEDSNEPEPGKALTIARSWRCQDIAGYLRDMYYSNHRPHHPQSYGKQQLSQYIDWPSSFGNQYGFVRVPRHFELENLEVGEALSRLARKAGPYEINMVPVGWRGQMQLVQVNSRKGGTYLVGPRYGSDVDGGNITDCLEDSTRISGGAVTESIVGYFDDVCIAGDPPAVEHQFATTDSDDPVIELENGWSPEEEQHFKDIIINKGLDEAAFQMACTSEPRVYCSYRVKSNYQAYLKTNWPSWAPPYNPRILPQLLSGYAQGNNNPRDWNPREITIEWQDESVSPAVWKACTRFDNLELIDNGTAFRVEALRNASTQAADRVTFSGTFGDAAAVQAMKANNMRLTCAVEREFRITGVNKTDPNSTYARVNQVERFTFLAVGAPGDYSHWERYNSFPNGNGASDLNLNFPDKCQGGSGSDQWLFSDLEQGGSNSRINRHALHRIEEVKRIDYHGILTMHTWNPGLQPGMQVMVDMGRKPIIPKAVIKCVKFNSMTQAQEIELMAGDNSVIYDMPLPVQTSTDGGKPKPSSSTTSKENPSTGADDYPQEVKKQESKSSVTTSANDPNYGQTSTTASAVRGGDSRTTTERDSSKENSKDLMNIIKSNIEDRETYKQEAETRRTSIRTGDQMSKVDEDKFSPEAADRRRAEAKRSAADATEAAIMKKALRNSTVQSNPDEVE
jgi:hypothetical protein